MDSIVFAKKSLKLITPGNHAKRFNTRDSIYEKQQTAVNLSEKTINQHNEAYKFDNLPESPNNPSEMFYFLNTTSSTKGAEKALVVFFSNFNKRPNLAMIALVKELIQTFPSIRFDQTAVNIDCDHGTALFGLVLQKMNLEKKLCERIADNYKLFPIPILGLNFESFLNPLDKIYSGQNLRIISKELTQDYHKNELKEYTLLDIFLKDTELKTIQKKYPEMKTGSFTLYGFQGVIFLLGKSKLYAVDRNLDLGLKYHQLSLLSKLNIMPLNLTFLEKIDLRLLNGFLNLYLLFYIETLQGCPDADDDVIEMILSEFNPIEITLKTDNEVQEVLNLLSKNPFFNIETNKLEVTIEINKILLKTIK